METRDEYVAKMKKKLDEWNKDMKAMESNAHKIKEDAKAKYQAQLKELKAKHQEGEKNLEAIKAAADNTWESLKSGTEKVWGALTDSMQEFKKHFK